MTVIIGATAASILFVLLMIILVVIICCCCRKKRNSETDSEEFNTKKVQNIQLNNSKNTYPYQYHHASAGVNGGGMHANGNGKVAYSELESVNSDHYR